MCYNGDMEIFRNPLLPNPQTECIFPGMDDFMDLKVDLGGEMNTERNCRSCICWEGSCLATHGDCDVHAGARTYLEMSCPRWGAKEVEIPERLKKWVPVWHAPIESIPDIIPSIYTSWGYPTRLYLNNGWWTELP